MHKIEKTARCLPRANVQRPGWPLGNPAPQPESLAADMEMKMQPSCPVPPANSRHYHAAGTPMMVTAAVGH